MRLPGGNSITASSTINWIQSV